MKAALRSSIFALVAVLAASCAPSGPQKSDYLLGYNRNNGPTGKGEHHSAPAIPDDISYWDGEGATGAPLIKINRAQQKAYFYKGGQLVAISKISSGKEDHGTPAGRYKISQKDLDHKSSTYGCIKDKATGMMVNDNADIRTPVLPGQIYYAAPMPYFMRFADGIGMHTGFLPGYAASHGCIRMPDHMARHFFENVEVGTPVIVE
ncbi:L,D-transpeptidase family protein [Luteolibacter sp. LG18]|uniref:L,D-transpeptidase family protein n=1 Tax=Luteolibacter sp. LG18 TaxID=2819286 RepID=UPI002B2C77C7|nr:hypothetical protein llg_06150 [Luteolibacter sp. LG18]